MTKIQAISLRSQWLGEKLRAARLASGFRMVDAAEYIQTDQTTLGRFERGTHRMRRVYVQGLLDFYSVTDKRERSMMLHLADDAWRKDWWDGDTSDLDTGFIDYTWLEARAKRICVFEPLLVHGLLQTPEYARALSDVSQTGQTKRSDGDRITEVRKARQRILTNARPTRLSAILEEPALRRVIGNVEVARGQLRHLLELSKFANVNIRVLSVDASWDPGYSGPFTYFDMPDPYPHIAYLENLAGRTFLENRSKVERFRCAYDELGRLALSPRRSADFMHSILRELE